MLLPVSVVKPKVVGIKCHPETWWWNEEVDSKIKEKRRLWKEWKKGGSKETYLLAKRSARKAVYVAKKDSQKETFSSINTGNDCSAIFKLARRMKNDSRDVVGENCIRGDNGKLVFNNAELLQSWRSHYDRLLNEEFEWDANSLSVVNPVEGPPIFFTEEMIGKAIEKLKSGKAPGPSGITAEMIKSGGADLTRLLVSLLNKVVYSQKIPSDWNNSFIINCFKGKGDSLERGNYRGLKLLELVMKILERILEVIIRDQIHIDDMQFGFMPGRSTIDAIFTLRQVQEKHLSKKKEVYFAFIDLEKAFDRVPRKVLWWAMRKVGVEEWVINIVKAMYSDATSQVRVSGEYSEPFNVKVGVHQGSVLSPLLFIIVMEALSREFRTGCPWELLYADDLVIISESLEELVAKIDLWKSNIESKGLRVNMTKTKIMCCSHNVAGPPKQVVAFPCGVCDLNVGVNSIFCSSCARWVHKRCTNIKGRLRADPSFQCARCKGICPPSPVSKLVDKVECGGGSLEVVRTFCYLGDTVGQSGGCKDAINARIQSSWKAFRSLLPILTNRSINLKIRGHVLNSCVLSVLLYASETWAITTSDVSRLQRNFNSMLRWICGVSLADHTPSMELVCRLGLHGLPETLRWHRLRLYGHLLRHPDSWPSLALLFDVNAPYPKGRPKQRWTDVIGKDLKILKIDKELANDRNAWKKTIKPSYEDTNLLQPSGNRRKRRINEE